MKIAFWSNFHGQSGTTSNMLAVAIMSVLDYKAKVFLAQSHYSMNNLNSSFISVTKPGEKSYFMNVGIDAIIRAIKTRYLDEEIIENCTLSYMNKKLILLPSTVKSNNELYEEDLNRTINSILGAAEKYHDLVLIDVNSRTSGTTNKILDYVDLIVVNLRQNPRVLKDYEENFLEDFKDKNIIYMFGNYNPNSLYSIKNLKSQYPWLRRNKLGLIPYNLEFMDSVSSRNTIAFFSRNHMIEDKNDPNSYFIKEVKKACQFVNEPRKVKR